MGRRPNAHRLLRAAGQSRRAYSIAYIDGAHTYEQSMRDFQNVSRHLIGGGFIVFDDSATIQVYPKDLRVVPGHPDLTVRASLAERRR